MPTPTSITGCDATAVRSWRQARYHVTWLAGGGVGSSRLMGRSGWRCLEASICSKGPIGIAGCIFLIPALVCFSVFIWYISRYGFC